LVRSQLAQDEIETKEELEIKEKNHILKGETLMKKFNSKKR